MAAMDNPIPRHHHLASPRAAAAFGALAFAGIGATIMAPQAFFIGLYYLGSPRVALSTCIIPNFYLSSK